MTNEETATENNADQEKMGITEGKQISCPQGIL